MAKYLMQNRRLLQVKLMDTLLTHLEFLPGIPFGFRRKGALPNFLETVRQSTSVKELSLANLDLGPVIEMPNAAEPQVSSIGKLRYL
jgi:hypothetical protein